ncbi:enoyl-CoA hydratase/isomerase family protein [Paeniroseomonas aquatica]|uniref:Enoyl-CoA hydratase/isomerase family protein n=1 Tax=Paeniroseomonas aquatica TaxID=373043 RepID=A0ABT8AEL5_9PROT|nr:enoyl-CoA hydratase/isomerase family protein [Paeniroseomonas aquatica]MDN3568194.1 enoyl-CoA hydratase/isomerase family protein [Paeniroseomonas aquatica]
MILTSRTDGVATLGLNRPDRGNALGPELVEQLTKAFDEALATGARLIVLRGEGRHFCTGFDLTDLESLTDGDLLLRVVRIEALLQRIHAAPVTTMAIASGRTFGAGADLFAACDHRIALAGASFAFPGPAFGLVLGTNRLASLVGRDRARATLLAGAEVPAAAALAAGLATATMAAEDTPAAIAVAAEAAARLDPATVAALHQRTSRAEDDADLAALVRSAARPGLKQRILDYRAAVAARGKS